MTLIDVVQHILSAADIKINGDRPWDITVHNERFYRRVLSDGLLGVGESYVDGDWNCKDLHEAAYRALRANIGEVISQLSWREKLQGLQARLMNMQSKRRSYTVGRKHYDVGNDLYQKMLDKRMVYSCGYWRKGANNLDEAQEAKLDLICRKLGLKKGDTVLDIGSGFGGFLIYAAETYGARGTGVTVSEEQARLARDRSAGLPIEILLQDYREPIANRDGTLRKFDHIVSIGMIEHVGPKNYRTFMEVANDR